MNAKLRVTTLQKNRKQLIVSMLMIIAKTINVKNHVRTHFLIKMFLSANSLLQKNRNKTMFGYVQCDLTVPDELQAKFSKLPPIFKNIDVTRNDFG